MYLRPVSRGTFQLLSPSNYALARPRDQNMSWATFGTGSAPHLTYNREKEHCASPGLAKWRARLINAGASPTARKSSAVALPKSVSRHSHVLLSTKTSERLSSRRTVDKKAARFLRGSGDEK
jgi:hypothetical protein